jgi:hypothetical protein
MKGDNGRSTGSSCRFSDSVLANLPRRTMSLGAETAQQLHHVMVMFWRGITDAEYPIEQIGVGTIEQRLEPAELAAIQTFEERLGKRTEDDITLLRAAMPAPEQKPPAANISLLAL